MDTIRTFPSDAIGGLLGIALSWEHETTWRQLRAGASRPFEATPRLMPRNAAVVAIIDSVLSQFAREVTSGGVAHSGDRVVCTEPEFAQLLSAMDRVLSPNSYRLSHRPPPAFRSRDRYQAATDGIPLELAVHLLLYSRLLVVPVTEGNDLGSTVGWLSSHPIYDRIADLTDYCAWSATVGHHRTGVLGPLCEATRTEFASNLVKAWDWRQLWPEAVSAYAVRRDAVAAVIATTIHGVHHGPLLGCVLEFLSLHLDSV